jgi:3-dehydroquinate dehydratase
MFSLPEKKEFRTDIIAEKLFFEFFGYYSRVGYKEKSFNLLKYFIIWDYWMIFQYIQGRTENCRVFIKKLEFFAPSIQNKNDHKLLEAYIDSASIKSMVIQPIILTQTLTALRQHLLNASTQFFSSGVSNVRYSELDKLLDNHSHGQNQNGLVMCFVLVNYFLQLTFKKPTPSYKMFATTDCTFMNFSRKQTLEVFTKAFPTIHSAFLKLLGKLDGDIKIKSEFVTVMNTLYSGAGWVQEKKLAVGLAEDNKEYLKQFLAKITTSHLAPSVQDIDYPL